MSAFDRALRFVLRWEGGHSKDPDDAGGETYCGISRVHHPDWPGWALVTSGAHAQANDMIILREDLNALLLDFYRTEYWYRLRCDDMPENVAIALFDSGVNCGRGTSAKWLQNAAYVPADGIIGPKTIAAVNANEHETLVRLIEQRSKRYDAIVANNPSQAKFLNGWKNRLDALRKEVGL